MMTALLLLLHFSRRFLDLVPCWQTGGWARWKHMAYSVRAIRPTSPVAGNRRSPCAPNPSKNTQINSPKQLFELQRKQHYVWNICSRPAGGHVGAQQGGRPTADLDLAIPHLLMIFSYYFHQQLQLWWGFCMLDSRYNSAHGICIEHVKLTRWRRWGARKLRGWLQSSQQLRRCNTYCIYKRLISFNIFLVW